MKFMETIVALPKSNMQTLVQGNPQYQAMVEQYGVEAPGSFARELLEMRNRQEFILYCKYTPQLGDNSHNYFENTGAWANPQWTNIKVAGQIPFKGKFKVMGIGMLIESMLNQEVADTTHILDGYFVAKFGSQEGIFLQAPLADLYSQDVKCCMTNASPSATPVTQLVSNSVFTGRNGYLALPSAPVIKSGDQFVVEVTWNTAWVANSGVTMGFRLFGKRYMPVSDEVSR